MSGLPQDGEEGPVIALYGALSVARLQESQGLRRPVRPSPSVPARRPWTPVRELCELARELFALLAVNRVNCSF